jgi:enoyl-CoA hydratase/carnithine racemase
LEGRAELAELLESSVDEFGVALLQLNRPEARNALSPEMMERIASELERLDPDPEVRCVVIAGSEKVFAAGADIRSMAERTLPEALYHPAAGFWKQLAAVKTPMVAAVSGFALGGGCELALACDMIVAAESARFGQPEINLGIIPGGGGTQRLARTIGKQRAMELVLTGKLFDARTAHEWGLVNLIAAEGAWLEEALELARRIAAQAPLASRLGKQAVLAAEETALSAGLDHERRLFEVAMATEDRVEGMKAFLEKRDPEFKGK